MVMKELPIVKADVIHYDVLIATPAFSFVPEYVTSLVATTRMLNEKGISYHLLHKSGSFIPSTREQVATDSYGHNWKTNEIGGGKYTYKKIFWIDSDIEWTPEDFLRIYDSDMDVVSGVYQTHPNGTVAVNLSDPQGRPTLVNKSDFLLRWDPVEVGGVGFGFVAMKHGVFESMKRPWFKIREVFWEENGFAVNMGEDYSWCEGAKEAGYKIWVDSLVKVKHHKGTVYVVE
jgi:hypothetical protein